MVSSDEEEAGMPASYAARLSSSGTEGRRSSFGAKLTTDVSADGGQLDKAIAMSKPSDFPTFNPFKVTTSAVDSDLFIAAQEDPDIIADHVDLCAVLLMESEQIMSAELDKVSKIFNGLSEESLIVFTEEKVEAVQLAKILSEKNGERNAAAHVAMQHLIHTIDLTKLIERPVNRVISELMRLQDASQEVELKQVREKTLFVFEKHIDLAISGSLKKKVKNSYSQSQLHFRDTLEQLKKLHKSYLALDEQYSRSVDSHTTILATLESGKLDGEDLDKKIAEATKVSTRSAELKKIKEHKMSQIYQLLEQRYPDIAGSGYRQVL